MLKKNNSPTGLNGHPSIRDNTLTSCQQPFYRINKNQRWYRKAGSQSPVAARVMKFTILVDPSLHG